MPRIPQNGPSVEEHFEVNVDRLHIAILAHLDFTVVEVHVSCRLRKLSIKRYLASYEKFFEVGLNVHTCQDRLKVTFAVQF